MAGVAVAERITHHQLDELHTPNHAEELPLVINVAELDTEALVRNQAAAFFGALAINHEVEVPAEIAKADRIDTLQEAIERAKQGDPVAVKFLDTNILSDMLERSVKAGLVIETFVETLPNGETFQHGQTGDQTQANSLLYASNSWQIRERTEAETRNKFRIDMLHKAGLLEDYYFVVFSRVADNMNEDELYDAGFFTETMSVSIQATGPVSRGLKTESAFVAGIKEPGGEQYDAEATVGVGAALNQDFQGLSTTKLLDSPRLIHKSLMPNGVIDIVKLWDDQNGTFFGQNKPQQDYQAFKEQCREWSESLQPRVEAVRNELIRRSVEIKNPADACIMLDELSDQQMVQQATLDPTIDPTSFGPEAAVNIVKAREAYAMGDHHAAVQHTRQAESKSQSTSCPGGANGRRRRRGGGWWMWSNNNEDDPNATELDPDDWHGGKIIKKAKCNSCKKVKEEIGGCRICEECVGNPERRKKAWAEYEDSKKAAPPTSILAMASRLLKGRTPEAKAA